MCLVRTHIQSGQPAQELLFYNSLNTFHKDKSHLHTEFNHIYTVKQTNHTDMKINIFMGEKKY